MMTTSAMLKRLACDARHGFLLFSLIGTCIETQDSNIQGHELGDRNNDIVL
jgi:hypothetical protein